MAAGKIIFGLILVLAGLWLILPASYCFDLNCQGLWTYLWDLVKGLIPVTIVLLGLLIIWIESEELKYTRPRRKR